MNARGTGLLLLLSAVLAQGSQGCRRGPRRPVVSGPSLLGGERGIDHVGVAVKDLREARQTYQQRLGFDRPISGRLPNGIDNVNFYFEDATYLETLTFYDRRKADWLAWFIDHFTEGGNFAVLSVRSANETAAFLRQRGFAMSPPSPGRIQVDLEGGKPGGTWQTLFFDRSPLPGSPLYFIEYPRESREDFLHQLEDPEVRRRSFHHRNTAVGIRAVWMAVPDLLAATRAYASLGLKEEEAFESPQLDARAQSIAAGRSHIILFSPRGDTGPVKEFLGRRGPGLLGMAIEVQSIQTAMQVIGQDTGDPQDLYAGRFGPSLLVAPKHAHGTWIEFFQPPTQK